MSLPHQPGCACCTLPRLSTQLDALQHHNWTESLSGLIRVAAERAKLALHQDAAIFHGGPIYTLQGGQPGRVEALGVAHGKVVSVGSLRQVEADMQAQPRAERIDLRGKTLLPGMVDPHVHILPSALYRNWVNLSPFEDQILRPGYNLGWVAEKLRNELTARHGHTRADTQQWLTGFGVDPSLMTKWQEPDQPFLDQISTETPIFLINASGHLGYANSPAMKLAGLDPGSKGVTTEADIGKVLAVIPGLAAPHLLSKLQEILHAAASRGMTTLFDAGLGAAMGQLEITLLRAFAQSPLAPVRIGAALYSNQDWLQEQWLHTFQPNHIPHDDDRFSIRALKLIADGSNQGLTGYQSQDYCCADEHHVPNVSPRGLFNFEPPITFAAQLQRALNAGWPVLVHANGDQAVDYVLAAFELALYDENAKDGAPNSKLALRSRIEHASLLSDASIAAERCQHRHHGAAEAVAQLPDRPRRLLGPGVQDHHPGPRSRPDAGPLSVRAQGRPAHQPAFGPLRVAAGHAADDGAGGDARDGGGPGAAAAEPGGMPGPPLRAARGDAGRGLAVPYGPHCRLAGTGQTGGPGHSGTGPAGPGGAGRLAARHPGTSNLVGRQAGLSKPQDALSRVQGAKQNRPGIPAGFCVPPSSAARAKNGADSMRH